MERIVGVVINMPIRKQNEVYVTTRIGPVFRGIDGKEMEFPKFTKPTIDPIMKLHQKLAKMDKHELGEFILLENNPENKTIAKVVYERKFIE